MSQTFCQIDVFCQTIIIIKTVVYSINRTLGKSKSLFCVYIPKLLFSKYRYKDSISKSTRGWKERLFARNSSTSEVHGEAVQGTASSPEIPTLSRMMDHLQVEQVSRTNASNIVEDTAERQTIVMGGRPSSNEDDTRAPSAAASASN